MRDSNVIPFPCLADNDRHHLAQEIASIFREAESYVPPQQAPLQETVVSRLERAVARLEQLAQTEA